MKTSNLQSFNIHINCKNSFSIANYQLKLKYIFKYYYIFKKASWTKQMYLNICQDHDK